MRAPYDLSRKAIDEIDTKIFKFERKAEMVQLLLALSKEPNPDTPSSQFAKKFLHVKMRDNGGSDLFVKPSVIDFRQSDCSLIDRDKLLVNNGYVPYDARSFENPGFKKMLEQ